jgi:hypothetical protein
VQARQFIGNVTGVTMRASEARQGASWRRYFSDVLIDENLVLSLPPMPFTTAMLASAVPAAINPYLIAVAALSSHYPGVGSRSRHTICKTNLRARGDRV